MTEPDLRAPSLLPGWSRAYILAHLARGADAMRNLLVGARAGQDRPAYASPRPAPPTSPTAQLPAPKELMEGLAGSAMALRTVALQLPDQAWRYQVRMPGSPRFPASQLLTRRLAEVELHHCDLGIGTATTNGPPYLPRWNSGSRCGPSAPSGSAISSPSRSGPNRWPGRSRPTSQSSRCPAAGLEDVKPEPANLPPRRRPVSVTRRPSGRPTRQDRHRGRTCCSCSLPRWRSRKLASMRYRSPLQRTVLHGVSPLAGLPACESALGSSGSWR
jgi:maleylpyruvate isomerase